MGIGTNTIECGLQRIKLLLEQVFNRRGCEGTRGDELLRPLLTHGRQRVDYRIHLRLGKTGFVTFVMAIAAVADQVDHKVTFKVIAIGQRQPRRTDAGDWVISIDMDNRDLKALGQVAGIEGAARVAGNRGKADLVVSNNVNRAAGAIPFQPGKVQRFGHNTLAIKRRIAVNLDRQRNILILAWWPWLIDKGTGGARHSFDHWIHMFQMAGVGGHAHRQIDLIAVIERPLRAGVIFDIAGPA